MTDEEALLAANAAYYDAFRTAKFAEMCRIWADEDVSCVHPGWPALIGRDDVIESYRKILSNPNPEWIDPHGATVLVSGDEGRVLCVEIVAGSLALAATNWFRRVGGRWRLIHHHASSIAAAVVEEAPPPPGRLN